MHELFRNAGVNTSVRAAGDFTLSAAELQAFLSSPAVRLPLSRAEAKALVRALSGAKGDGVKCEVECNELYDALRARRHMRKQTAEG